MSGPMQVDGLRRENRSIDSWVINGNERAVPRTLTLKVWRCQYPNALTDTNTEKDQQIITLIGQVGEAGLDLPLEACATPADINHLRSWLARMGQREAVQRAKRRDSTRGQRMRSGRGAPGKQHRGRPPKLSYSASCEEQQGFTDSADGYPDDRHGVPSLFIY